ncbi:hypothetical protein QBC46DRAFT_378129 [Diplogelasinospora grovesii]|uniref:Uncharacterized protein n=1 Tax=Diplogelasinospora grovesii TaxID=303347 RepID=A0AAN6NE11_9PEZI|nr:hypothetical protein QBC46DRAFT_378129 [Diplogelasinospora grovesii]
MNNGRSEDWFIDSKNPPPPPDEYAIENMSTKMESGLSKETSRNGLSSRGNVTSGVSDIDENVLLGGFERGLVVGVSSEKEDFGHLIARQIMTDLMTKGTSQPAPKTLIITQSPVRSILLPLREAITRDLLGHGQDPDQESSMNQIMDNISIARVHDIEHLFEALDELLVHAGLEMRPDATMGTARLREVADTGKVCDHAEQTRLYDIIVITHMDLLLDRDVLIHGHQLAKEHTQALREQLDKLTRSAGCGRPMVMLLNTARNNTTPVSSQSRGRQPGSNRSLQLKGDRVGRPDYFVATSLEHLAPSEPAGPSYRVWPRFEQAMTRLVDVHIMCSRLPRTNVDLEVVSRSLRPWAGRPRWGWVIDVIGDKTGVWKREPAEESRRLLLTRLWRWGAVNVEEARVPRIFTMNRVS